MKAWLRSSLGQTFLFMLGAASLRYFPFWLGQTLFFGDNYSLLMPGKIWTAYWLRRGVWPLWNPLLFSGLNWVGDISQTPFSPTVLPFVILPPALALNFIVLVYFVFTGVGMYLLTKSITKHHWWSLVAAGLWACSSLWVGSANNLATLQSLSWFPWIIWGGLNLEWRLWPILRFTLLIAGQVGAGYPQHLLISLPAAAWLSLAKVDRHWRRWFSAWTAAVGLALGLTAAITLPFITTLLTSTRQLQSAAQAVRGSLHPAELIKIVLPYFFDAPLFGIRWGPNWNFYPTAMPFFSWLGLAALITTNWRQLWRNRLNRLIIWGTLASLGLSFGSRLPGYLWLLTNIPGLSMVRYPSSWLIITEIFGLVLVAAAAAHWQPPRWLYRWANPGLVIVLLTGLVTLLFWRLYPDQSWQWVDWLVQHKLSLSPFHTLARDRLIISLIAVNLTINAGFGWLTWQLWRHKVFPLLTAVLILEGVINSQALLLFAQNEVYATPTHFNQLTQIKPLHDHQYRTLTRNLNQPYTDYGSYWEAVAVRAPFSDSFVDSAEQRSSQHLRRLRDGLTPDWNLVAGVPVVNGYTTLLPTDYQRIWEPLEIESRINLLSPIALNNSLLANWSVKYYVVDKWFSPKEPINYPVVYENQNWTIYELPAATRFRFEDNTAVELGDFTQTPNSLSFTLQNQNNHSRLIIADRYETGWQATVNGQPIEVQNWQGMRRITIVNGENQIKLKYWPQEISWGITISILTALLMTTAVIFSRQRYHSFFQQLLHNVKRI